ncbi:Ppx/GppA phosphatase family protein [Tepidibacter formicigenes]|jgi:exopolyphosphatase/guanosine-5'-triphosphate,3'-diphosphate pyrophosphatase|uniref:Exopolyphosphatase / guanosine-5'-triphosphate,3'-diphosphate pyrophosphatase n=1 Tax=Tepidibacter formicigenes DSM 15518 TaxID=1123349 RepID=A0A1M6NTN6_9FIRM|nr:Ppx/GppA phosphatase family protein [Tepidibacter formicigenes]SHJ98978.1 exopolyphosphatase / guanosine-5'-triphosphate,3'-diphosphate pyrophosphatase [Tepidibacter formicigenes DSM 15518]
MKVAAIDIGTNSMRLLMTEYVDGKFFDRQKYINTTRIGQDVDKEGFISKEAINRNINALDEFVNTARNKNCKFIFAMGTSALRDSKNKSEFLEKAYSKTGVNVEIISGYDEANLGFLGVLQGIEEEGDILVIDIGGGSTEFIVGNKEEGIKFSKSENVGALRMTEKFLKSDPVDDCEFKKLEEYVKTTINNTLDNIKNFNIKKAVGIGGTITSLSAISQCLEVYSMDKIHNSLLSNQEIENILQNLKKLSVEKKKNIKGLQPKRADIITAGAGILNIIIKELKFEDMTISEFDNLEGLICQKLKIMS